MDMHVSDLTETRTRFLAVLEIRGEMTSVDFEETFGRSNSSTNYLLLKMFKDGLLDRSKVLPARPGRQMYSYRLTSTGSEALKLAREDIATVVKVLQVFLKEIGP
jgi:predicted transcriptional regulator